MKVRIYVLNMLNEILYRSIVFAPSRVADDACADSHDNPIADEKSPVQDELVGIVPAASTPGQYTPPEGTEDIGVI